MATRSDKSILRILEKLENKINCGEYYEAHQLYRTLYFRYSNQKKVDELLQLLYKGTKILLEHNQLSSGGDLANLLVEVLKQNKIKPTEEWIQKLVDLFELMKENFPEKDSFLLNCVKWSVDDSNKGNPVLHKKIAEIYWKQKKYTMAHKHFLHSNDGVLYATMLISLHTTSGLKNEIDLFIAQAVLQFLARHNMEMAKATFDEYVKSHPDIKSTEAPHALPLLNFLWLLMTAIEEKKVEKFNAIKTFYEVSLNRDPNFKTYLETIGKVWFGIAPKCKGNKMHKSLLSGLLGSLLKDAPPSDDDEEDEEDQFVTASSGTPDLD